MKILTFNRDDKNPENISEKTEKIGRLIIYLVNTKDENLINHPDIEKIEIYDTTYVKVYINTGQVIIFDYGVIEWLKTHHYMYKARYCKEEAEKLYDLIYDKIDWFIVDDWYIKNRTQYGNSLSYNQQKGKDIEVTYDKNTIYVRGKDTGLKMTPDMVNFVESNKNKWY